jgi:predicted DCC family thiol-disulfide oxidoreductase YuxK
MPPDQATTETAAPPVLFFDGVCGLCNRFVDFILRHDRRRKLQMAPLQGETAARALSDDDRASLSTVVLLRGGRTYRRSAAVVRVLWDMGRVWTIAGALLWCVPRPLRDIGYNLVASNRYRLFGKKETCRLPTPEERGRVLP